MSGVWFLDSTGKFVTITDPDNRPRDVSYFTFRSSLNPHTVDPRAPNSVHKFEFSLRLPHNYPSSSVNLSLSSPSIVPNQSSVPTFNESLSGLSDALLNQMLATEMRDMLSAQRESLFISAPSNASRTLNFSTPNYSTTTVVTTSTTKWIWSAPLLLSVPLILDYSIFWIIKPVSTIFLDLLWTCCLLLLALLMRLKSMTLFDQRFQLCVVALNCIFFVI